MLVIVIIHW